MGPFAKRSVSPLEAEPISVHPEDVLFAGSDDEESEEEQRRKRRRIEDLGRKYLEGKPLFILSAGFKGPFESGWTNPWRKKKYDNDGTEIQSKPTEGPTVIPEHLAVEKEISDTSTSHTGTSTAVSVSANLPSRPVGASALGFPGRTSVEASSPTPSLRAVQQAKSTAASTRSPEKNQSPNERHTSRFTPVNIRARLHSAAPSNAPAELSNSTSKPLPVVPARMQNDDNVTKQRGEYGAVEYKDANDLTKEGYKSAKDIGQKALQMAVAGSEGIQANATSPSTTTGPPLPVSEPFTSTDGREVSQRKTSLEEQNVSRQHFADIQYQPTNQKPKTPPEKAVSDRGSFAQRLKANKARVTAKRLSFTPNGGIKAIGSRSDSRTSSASATDARCVEHAFTSSLEKRSKNESSREADRSSSTSARAGPSDIFPQGPEAQLVSAQPGQLGGSTAPSGPSTDLLGPAHATDEGDSYLDLSTQAAIAKAQRSLQTDMISPLQTSPSRIRTTGDSQLSPTASRTPGAGSFAKIKKALPNPITPTGEPLNTQAMLEAISPFAVTTIKKPVSLVRSDKVQKRTSFASSPLPSPSHTFGPTRRSLSMSTSSESPSPSPAPPPQKSVLESKPTPILSRASTAASKPFSIATSTAFSIAPNGTLTEVYQQDGQQPLDAGLGMGMEMDDWDTDEAIEDANSFLGTWNIGHEARKETNTVLRRSGG